MRMLGALLVGAALVASACGGSAASAQTAAASAAPAAPAAAPAQNTTSQGSAADQIERGKLIFQKTAGGVGCQYCHGPEGKGGASAANSVNAPNIRGTTEAKLRAALAGGAALMTFIKLTDQEIEDVLAYLQYLDN